MTDLVETAKWEAGIYQLEQDDLVKGGADGIDNVQARQLANRTAYLKALVAALGTGKQDAAVTLAALATLAGSADKLAYFTGANSAALTSFTAFARTLVAAADAATVRSAIGAVTKTDIDTAVAALVNASPATLDTLNEFAAALGNDPNFATTIANALSAKAPLASPALTGNPTAPTPDATDKSVKIATTAWLYAAMATVMAYFGFACSFTTNGYIKFPSILGGLIIQWGTVVPTTGGTVVTFPLVFPSWSLGYYVVPSGNVNVWVTGSATQRTNFNVFSSASAGGTLWFAIGY